MVSELAGKRRQLIIHPPSIGFPATLEPFDLVTDGIHGIKPQAATFAAPEAIHQDACLSWVFSYNVIYVVCNIARGVGDTG